VGRNRRLEPKSGGDWNTVYLASLRISIVYAQDSTTIIEPCELSEKGIALSALLETLTVDELIGYPAAVANLRSCDSSKYLNPIYKAIYLADKYRDHESAVDCLLSHLLSALGFNDDRLFSFPQLRIPLHFGRADVEWAIADYTILDVISFYRCCFCEDKIVKEVLVNCENKIVAEGIALHQQNSRLANAASSAVDAGATATAGASAGSDVDTDTVAVSTITVPSPIVGVRVSGFQFYFYSIPYSKAALTAMQSKMLPTDPTEVVCYPQDGLNFLSQVQRPIIISLLDSLRATVAKAGTASVRRISKLKDL
jgi:hypothetical protein